MFHGLILLLLAFQEQEVPCGVGATTAAGARPNLDGTTGITRITDRDTIIKRHEKSVGVPVKKGCGQPCVIRICETMKRCDGPYSFPST